MIRHFRTILPALGILAAPIAFAQSVETYIGPELGVFIPADKDLRDALGSNWISFGLGRLRVDQTGSRRFAWDVEFTSQSKNGSKVFMGAVSYGLMIPFGGTEPYALSRSGSNFTPYAAVRAGGSYIDFAVNTNGGRLSGKRIGLNANAEVGVLIGDRISVSARYDLNPSHNGLSFSGLTLAARYGLFRF